MTSIRTRIAKGKIVYIAYRHAPQYADRIADPFGPLLCKESREGLVTVAMTDGTAFLNGEPTLTIAHKRIVPNPPPPGIGAAQ